MDKPFVELDIVVKTYDVDMAQIVHNAVYIRWLEDLRTAMMDKYLPLQHWMARDLMPVLLETRISYRRAVKLFDAVHGRLEMPRIGPVKWEMAIQFTVNGELRADARAKRMPAREHRGACRRAGRLRVRVCEKHPAVLQRGDVRHRRLRAA